MKKEIRKERISLTLLYLGMVIGLQLITLVVSGLLGFLFARLGLLTNFGFPKEPRAVLFLFFIVINAIVGIPLTYFTRNFSLNLFNRLIDNMNRLAQGDFKARLTFGKPIQAHPAFVELSDSFNIMAQELENTELLRRDFVNNFSHEFKTPIVSIAGFAKLLRRGNLTQEQQEEYLAIIEEESLRLSSMATNVLNLTKLENQTILTDVAAFNLSEQIRSCILLLEDAWSKKDLSLDLDFDEYEITANEELLKQVWINLLDNAIKYSPSTGELILRIDREGSRFRVSFTNFGSEIPPDKLEKIWNKFYQADESHSTPGNGIGLAIVKRVAELHQGTASVESQDGMTTFTVTLPCHP